MFFFFFTAFMIFYSLIGNVIVRMRNVAACRLVAQLRGPNTEEFIQTECVKVLAPQSPPVDSIPGSHTDCLWLSFCLFVFFSPGKCRSKVSPNAPWHRVRVSRRPEVEMFAEISLYGLVFVCLTVSPRTLAEKEPGKRADTAELHFDVETK